MSLQVSAPAAGQKPIAPQTKMTRIGQGVYSNAAGGKPKPIPVKKTVIRQPEGAAGASTTLTLNHAKSDRMMGIMKDSVVKASKLPVNKSLNAQDIDGAKVKGIRWVRKESNVNQVTEGAKPKVLHNKRKKPIDSLNTKDIQGTNPRTLHKAMKLKLDIGGSLNASDICGSKPQLKQYQYQRKELRNPLEPIKETAIENTKVTQPAKTIVEPHLNPTQKIGRGQRMQSAFDYTDVYKSAIEKQIKIKQIAQTPRVKEEINGAAPKRLTFDRKGTEFNMFNTDDIDGATPRRKTFNMGSAIESNAAGMRPELKQGKIAPKPLQTTRSADSKSFLFGNEAFGGNTAAKKSFKGLDTQRHANSNGIAGIFGGAIYGDYTPPRSSMRSSMVSSQSSSKTYASSGVASILSHPQ